MATDALLSTTHIISLLQVAVALIALSIGAYYDVKMRVVPTRLAYIFVASEALLLALNVYYSGLPRLWLLYATIDALAVGVVTLLVVMCLKGPGDLYMITGAILSRPWGTPLLPSGLVLLLYYSLYSLAPFLYMLLGNLLSRDARRALGRLPLWERLYRLFTARLLPAKKLNKENTWWIPLDLGEARRSVCDTSANPWDVVRRAIRENKLREDELLWATYGIPAVLPLLAAYVTLLVVGDTPIILLLNMLLHTREA